MTERADAQDPAAWRRAMTELDNASSDLRAGPELSALEDKLHYSALPEALYHATTVDAVTAIMRDGLRPSPLLDGAKPVVALSDNAEFALAVAALTQQVSPDQLRLIEVTTQGQSRADFLNYAALTPAEYARLGGYDEAQVQAAAAIHEVHYFDAADRPINPDFLHLLSTEELRAELSPQGHDRDQDQAPG
jgi:hypothetical protein